MRIKVILGLFLISLLLGCGDNTRKPAPVINQAEETKEVSFRLPDQVYTADGKLIGTEQSVKDSLNKIVLGKSRTLTKKENDFICNCFIKELRASNDADSLLSNSLHKCSELLKVQREKENPSFFIYTKDGYLIGNKKTMKADILKEMKEKKVQRISDPLLDVVVDCIGEKYSKMTSKEIAQHKDIFAECLMDTF